MFNGTQGILLLILLFCIICLVYIWAKHKGWLEPKPKPGDTPDYWSNRIGTQYVAPLSEKEAARRQKIDPNVSPLDMIDDPAAAAVVMMLAVAKEKGPLTPGVEDVIRKELILSVAPEDPEEILLFSKWAPLYAEDTDHVLNRFSGLWQAAMTPEEQEAMLGRLERVAQAEGGIVPAQADKLTKLRAALGLPDAQTAGSVSLH